MSTLPFLYPQITAILKGTPTKEDWECIIEILKRYCHNDTDRGLADTILLNLRAAARHRKQLDVVPESVTKKWEYLKKTNTPLLLGISINADAIVKPHTKRNPNLEHALLHGLSIGLTTSDFKEAAQIHGFLTGLGGGAWHPLIYLISDLPRLASYYPQIKAGAHAGKKPLVVTQFLKEVALLYTKKELQTPRISRGH